MCKHYSNFFHLFFLYRQEMEDKQYMVPIHLIEQLKQITGISIRRKIQAQNRMISIIPFPCITNGLQRFPLPQQNLIHVDDRTVEITSEVGVQWITIIFPDSDAKEHFVTQLGDLNV
jgi:hypothetical protein